MTHLNSKTFLIYFGAILLVLNIPRVSGRRSKKNRSGGDACEKGTHNCHKDAICENSRRSYNCKCKPGYYGNGKICIDVDECEYGNDCVHFCQNSIGNYSCSCLSGFQLDRDGHNCIDVNECFTNRGNCQHQCVNTLGSYECKCNSGHTLSKDGRSCQSGRWCLDRKGCQHHCESTGRGVRCTCRQNYVLHPNGKSCIPTCAVGNGGCHHKCKDTAEGPVCSCAEKYMLRDDKKTCIETCEISNGGCDRKCNSTDKGPICSCPVGYALHQDGKTCLDIDECVKNNGGCSHECVNTHGGFECLCPDGFAVRGDRLKCFDIDECSLNRTCDHKCINTPGKYDCECNDGYQLYGKTHCADINECLVHNGGCQHYCKNTEGGYVCTCMPGFKLHENRKDCVVANRCSNLKRPSKATLSCFRHGSEEQCNLKCHKNAYFIRDVENTTVSCGPKTRYIWSHELNNSTLPSCSEIVQPPFLKRRAKFVFVAQKCKVRRSILRELQKNLTNMLNAQKRYQCSSMCKVVNVGLQCGSNRRRFRRLIKGREDHELITAEIEIQRGPVKLKTSRKCNVECLRHKTEKRLKKTIKKLRKSVNKEKFFVKYEDNKVEVAKKSFKPDKKVLMSCGPGTVLVAGRCIFCSIGTYYDEKTKFCMPCKSGTYQDEEGKLSCKRCPRSVRGSGITGAKNKSECSVLCDPGTHSDNGFKPCQQCARGYYQVDYGRTSCVTCGAGLSTKRTGSTGFQDCQTPVSCKPGTYYEIHNRTCTPCKIGTYQPRERQNHCLPCPGSTLTDFLASTKSSQCKNRKCGGYVGKFHGILESPNYPGDYPNDISCVWKIKPGKGRRVLVIVPEMFLPPEDKCGDALVMRKSRSSHSQTTYEACETTKTPRAFTARSRKLWIKFKSNGNNTSSGFSIPFVTYDENYHDLIEDIVSDGRLYSSLQHQSILKDRKLLTTLMEVIENPNSYFKYAPMSKRMFPKSFIRLLTHKVKTFLDI